MGSSEEILDPEGAYKRALELMDEFEVDAKEQMHSREFGRYTAWTRSRKYLEALMYVTFFDNTLRGQTLDHVITEQLRPYANIPLRNLLGVVERPIRPASIDRGRDDDLSPAEVYGADGPRAIRAEATLDVAERDDDFPFVL